ncbi:MAG: hypothetical protein IKU55_02915 [Clostridia bacterium]|nr:hypothetical protein [Clostridia bacterium]
MSEPEYNVMPEETPAKQVSSVELISEKLRRKKRRHRVIRVVRRCLIVLFLLAILGALGFGIYRYWDFFKPDTFRETVTLRDESKSLMKIGGALDIITGNTAKYTAFADGLAVVTTTNVRYATENGEDGFLAECALTQPTSVTEGDYLVVYDRGGRSILVADQEGVLASADSLGKIIGTTVNANGDIVVVSEADGYQCAVAVYDNHLNRRYTWKTPDYFATIGLASTEESVFAVAALQVQNQQLYSSVLLFDLKKEGVLAEIPLGRTAVVTMRECETGLLVITEEDAVCIAWDGTVCSRVSFSGDRVVGLSAYRNDLYLLLEVDNDVTVRYRLIRIGADGSLAAELSTKSEIKAISAGDGSLAVLTGHQICLYDTELDITKYISPEPGVTNIILMRGNKLIMITPQELFIA